jgi:hypothetical protein
LRFARLRFWLSNLFLVSFIAAELYSGFSPPLTKGEGFWPFRADWYMFSRESAYDFYLQAIGQYPDGHFEELSLQDLFAYPVADGGNRFQEVPRTQTELQDVGRYVCAHFPIRGITISDVSWVRPPGPRIQFKDLKHNQFTVTTYVNNMPCGS